jgi:hypothetical protein
MSPVASSLRKGALAVLLAVAPITPAFAAPQATVSIEFRGTLHDALKELASKAGINLVVTGELNQPAEVYLKDVSPTEALTTVAQAYQLQLSQKGNIWTLRPMTDAEKLATSTPTPPAPPAPDADKKRSTPSRVRQSAKPNAWRRRSSTRCFGTRTSMRAARTSSAPAPSPSRRTSPSTTRWPTAAS